MCGHYWATRSHIVREDVCVDFYSLILKRSGFFSGRLLGGPGGVKIGDGRRAGCHRRGLLNRLVRGRTESICTCTRVINGLRTDFKSWNNSLLQEKLSEAYRVLRTLFYKLNCVIFFLFLGDNYYSWFIKISNVTRLLFLHALRIKIGKQSSDWRYSIQCSR